MHLTYKLLFLSIFIALITNGQIVVIDAGHGYNPDCTNGDSRTSIEINTAHNVSHKLKDMIDSTCAWTTHLTRPNNGCGSWLSLTQRYIMANNWNADVFISIHCNAGGGTGTETFWCDQAAPPNIDDQNYATEIQNQMVAFGQWTDRRVVEDDSYLPFHLGVLRNLNMNGCLSEIGFVDTGDSVKLKDNSWRIEFARAYHTGLQNFLGVPCTTPNVLDCNNSIPLQCGANFVGPATSSGSNVNSYGCNNWTETGPERVHHITPLVSGTMTATLSNFTGDLDVYILGSCDPSDCIGTVSSNSAAYNNVVAGNTYYIVVDADDGSGSGYTLDISCSGTTPGQADLTCKLNDVNPTVTNSNDTIEAIIEIQNIGGDTAINFYLNFYLSTDSTISANDTMVSSNLITSLNPTSLILDTILVKIPFGWSGNTILIASVDDSLSVPETNETNNYCFEPLSITQLPSGILDCSSAIQIDCGVVYQGPQAFHASEVSTYGCNGWTETGPERIHEITITKSGTLTADISNFTGDLDVYILGSCDPSDCLGTVSSSSATYNNATPGTYYIVVDADDGSGSGYDLLVTCPSYADLTPQLFLFNTDTGYLGGSINFTVATRNIGSDTVGAFVTNYYLSSDQLVDAQDVLLTTDSFSIALPNSSVTKTHSASIPAGIPIGSYYFIAFTDASSVQTESDETNNTFEKNFYIDYPLVTFDEEGFNDFNMVIFPNPSEESFTIKSSIVGFSYSLFNSLGQLEMQGYLNTQQEVISWDNLPKGIYLLSIENEKIKRNFRLIHK